MEGADVSDVTPIRDPRTDHLLTPQNAVVALIDYQPEQYAGVASVGHGELLAPQGELRTLPCYWAYDPEPRMGGLDGFYAARIVRTDRA